MSDRYQVMPPLSDAEYEALKADIAECGVLVPVEYDEYGNILDGHHRVRACRELGIKDYPGMVRYLPDETERRAHARRLNFARRQLSRAQRRELIADEIAADPTRSDREIARLMGCDHKTVGSVRRELAGEVPHPETFTEVDLAMLMIEAAGARYQAAIGDEDRRVWSVAVQAADVIYDWATTEVPCLVWFTDVAGSLWLHDVQADVWELFSMWLVPVARLALEEAAESRGRRVPMPPLPGERLAELVIAVWSSEADLNLKFAIQTSMRDRFAAAVAEADPLLTYRGAA
jgi:hypothetical protein